MMKILHNSVAAIVVASVLLVDAASAANDALYYAIGGGQPIADSSSNRAATFSYGIGVEWSSNLTCGNFDLQASVQNQLNGVVGEFQNLMGSVISSATGVVASLPALAIQRLNPALYDLLQNGILQANEEFNVAIKSCEEMVSELSKTSETDGWRAIANTELWRKESTSGSPEVLDVEKRIAAGEGLDQGVTWVDGVKRGGDRQPPLELVGDATRAGYNILLNRLPSTTGSMVGRCGGAPLCESFNAPERQAEWVIGVLGERKVRTCEGCTPIETTAGMGLSRALTRVKEDVQTKLATLVASGSPPSAAELDEVSGGPNLQVTRRVIEAIREESEMERGALVRRLAGEMAMNRVMEYALMGRRSLLAGMKEPNIANQTLATDYLREAVAELDKEIENMTFEMSVRSRLSNNTTAILLQRSAARRNAPMPEQKPASDIDAGGVVR